MTLQIAGPRVYVAENKLSFCTFPFFQIENECNTFRTVLEETLIL